MMMPGGHGNENPNTNYMNGRGFWIFYLLVLGGVHIILLSVPVSLFSVAWVWTLTHVGHNAIQFWFLHWMKSHPWITFDQGSNRRLTHWEQIDHGVQYTPTRKFLTILPIMLYILASGYTKYDKIHFAINTLSLASVLIPKLPWFHRVRLFGINKKMDPEAIRQEIRRLEQKLRKRKSRARKRFEVRTKTKEVDSENRLPQCEDPEPFEGAQTWQATHLSPKSSTSCRKRPRVEREECRIFSKMEEVEKGPSRRCPSLKTIEFNFPKEYVRLKRNGAGTSRKTSAENLKTKNNLDMTVMSQSILATSRQRRS